jgi:Family of unknown function (DUF5372)
LVFEIVHPFHPDRCIRLEVLQTQLSGGERWLWYAGGDGKLRRVKESFTDRAALNGFVLAAAGRCAFRLRDLVGVAEWVGRSRGLVSR